MATISWYPVSVEPDADGRRFRVTTPATFTDLEISFFHDALKERFPRDDVRVDSYSQDELTLSFPLNVIADLDGVTVTELVSMAAGSATYEAEAANKARARLSSWASDLEQDPDSLPPELRA